MVVETAYYETLQVSVDCSASELKKSYRRLCLIHHPDKLAPGADASKFQQIQAAYEVLSDPEARESYDAFGAEGRNGGMGGGGGGGGGDDFMDDLFSNMFGPGMGGGPPPRQQQKRQKTQTRPSEVEFKVTLEELYMGKEKSIAVERTRTCGSCKGTGAKPRAQRRSCVKCRGAGQVHAIRQMGPYMTRVPVECPSCDGSGYTVRSQDHCKKCQGARSTKEKKKVDFFVERGSLPGEKIILSGEGDESPDSSSPGDLHIHLTLIPHSTFTLHPSPYGPTHPASLHTTLSLTLSESLLGFSRLILLHLDARGLRVHQPAPGEKGWRVLKSGDEVLVKGEGMWRKGEKGDLVLRVEVEMPDQEWALKLRGEGGVSLLEGLLPSKREDVQAPEETDEVELVERRKGEGEGEHHHGYSTRPTESDDEYEDEDDGRPSCHQQ